MTNSFTRIMLVAVIYIGTSHCSFSLSRIPPKPLAERVSDAEKICVGTLTKRVEINNLVHATLRVDKALRGTKVGEEVSVIWIRTMGDFNVFDAPEGARCIALLRKKRQGRYRLGEDQFLPVDKLPEVKKLLDDGDKTNAKKVVPSFEEWVAGGRRIPEGAVFTGKTPWFDENTGKPRPPKDVYRMFYGPESKDFELKDR